MKFVKMHGAGNDFVVIETTDVKRDWSKLAIAMCDRHFGIGADSLLLMLPSNKADCQMRIFDVDGSEAEACGNGLRCLVKYFVDRGLVKQVTKEVSVETIPGVRKARILETTGKITKVQTGMGEPKFRDRDIPVVLASQVSKIVDIKSMITCSISVDGQELSLNLVNMGNPHAVCFWQQPVSDFPLSQLGPKVENHKIFPRRINFEVARVISRKQIDARVWERGVGETLACGSGACAIAVSAYLHGYIDDKVDIKLPGGTLEVKWDGTGEVFLSGPAETVFTGEWPD